MEKEKVFTDFIDENLSMLRGVVWPIVRNAADTDDVIQQTLLKAWQKFDTFKEQAAFSSWVCRIAVNAAYDLKRRFLLEKRVLENVPPKASESADVRRMRLFSALDKAIEALPEMYRQAMLLTFVENTDAAHAAALAGCSPNTFYQRVFEAKKMLKKSLTEVNDED